MSEALEHEMPEELVRHLAGGKIVVVATVDEHGWPYTMIMNWALALDSRTIRLSLDNRTQTQRNVRATGRVMLEVLGDGLAYGVRGSARVILDEMQHAPVPSAIVEVKVDLVKRDLIPGVIFEGPKFQWGALEQFMGPLDPLGLEEMRAYRAGAGAEAAG